MADVEAQVTRFLAACGPDVACMAAALRARLRARLPGLTELVYVYERQGSVVCSYSHTGRGYEAPCALAVDRTGARLCFGQGAALGKADPHRLLEGRGKTVRSVPLDGVEAFDRPELEALLAAALALAGVRLDAHAAGPVVLKADEQKARARRTKRAPTSKPAPTRKRTPKPKRAPKRRG